LAVVAAMWLDTYVIAKRADSARPVRAIRVLPGDVAAVSESPTDDGEADVVDAEAPEPETCKGGQPRKCHARVHRMMRPDWLGMICIVISFSVLLGSYLSLDSYESYEAELNDRWGFLLHGKTSMTDSDLEGIGRVPVWLSEFGASRRSLWWSHLMRYAEENSVDWAYWSFNGEKFLGHDEPYGLVKEDGETVRHEWKLRDLQELIART